MTINNGVPRISDFIQGVASVAKGGATLMEWQSPLGQPINRIRDQLVAIDQYGAPDCVVIHGGAADAFAPTVGAHRTSTEGFEGEIHHLTDSFEAHGTAVYWLRPIPSGLYGFSYGVRQQVGDWLDANMSEKIIDCNSAIDSNGNNILDEWAVHGGIDYNHLSSAGTQAYAACLRQALTERGEIS